MLFESIVDSSGFQRSHFGRRTLQNQTASAGGVYKEIDLVVWFKIHLPSIPFREQDIQKAGDQMAAGQ